MMTKLEIAFAILVAFILVGGSIYLRGHHAGVEAETAHVAKQQAKTVAKHAKVVSHVQDHVDALPPAPATSAANTVRGSAADVLRDDWSRPE